MKNNLGALNEYLFAQLDVISNQDIKGNDLKEEVVRSKAITDIARVVIDNADTILKAKKYSTEFLNDAPKVCQE